MTIIDKSDILTGEDVKTLVHHFYDKVRKDELLAPVFNAVVKDNWDEHLQRMCAFWETILLHIKKYAGDPMSRHMPLPISKEHFTRWLFLFEESIDELFIGDTAIEAKKRANSIAKIMMNMKATRS